MPTTMFTPDLEKAGTDPAANFSLPDAETLARLASEMFRALPNSEGPNGGSPNDAVPAELASADPGFSRGGAGLTPANATPIQIPTEAPASVPSLPGFPADWSTPTGFKLPGEAELQALYVPDLPASVSPPQPANLQQGHSFYFLDESRLPARGGASTAIPAVGATPFDVHAIRKDFPILGERVNGRPLIWLDNAATTQKPWEVINRLSQFYQHENSNIHRAAHELAARSTDAYEKARSKVRRFLNAASDNEIVFVRGTTEAINLVAQSWGRQNIGPGDEIVITWLEHHANIVPWQLLCAEKGAVLRVAPVDDSGQVLLHDYERLLGPRTKLVSITQVSNALGTVTPVAQMTASARRHGARVLIDGAQSVAHMRADVQAIGCDWFVFSGHKVFGPTGIGALYGRQEVLEAMPPWQGGGNMIRDVTFERTEYHGAPARFEAGTGNIADAVGLGAALDYVERIGMENIHAYEHALLVYATRLLSGIPGLRLIGTATEKASVLSFVLDGFRSEDVGSALNKEGIAVRSGHHCAQPILRRFGLETTVRPSLAFYNTQAEIDALEAAIYRIKSGGVRTA